MYVLTSWVETRSWAKWLLVQDFCHDSPCRLHNVQLPTESTKSKEDQLQGTSNYRLALNILAQHAALGVDRNRSPRGH